MLRSNLRSLLLMLQQHLPFTVLKLYRRLTFCRCLLGKVATALTVYGIETRNTSIDYDIRDAVVATALTVYGIETFEELH